jgi:hypothetical protein
MRKLVRREVFHVVAMVGVLVLGARCGEMGEEVDHAHLNLKSALLLAERHNLKVCVEVDPELEGQRAELLKSLKEDLEAVKGSHPDWAISGLDRAPMQVSLGCPVNAMPSGRLAAKGERVGPSADTVPSPFRTHVYLLGDKKAAEVLGEQTAVRARAETLKVSDHELVEVSTALVLRASALGTSAARDEWLPRSVGLRQVKALAEEPVGDFVPKTYPTGDLTK